MTGILAMIGTGFLAWHALKNWTHLDDGYCGGIALVAGVLVQFPLGLF